MAGQRPTDGQRRALVGVVAVLAALVATLVAGPGAAPAGARHEDRPHWRFEPTTAGAVAEPADGPAHLVRDSPAVLWDEGEAVGEVYVEIDTHALHVVARGEPCEGLPRMVVEIGGEEVLDTEVGTRWGPSTFPITGSWAMGNHELRVRFPNPHATESCRRELKVLDVSGHASLPDPVTAVHGTDFAVPAGTGDTFRHGPTGAPAMVLWSDTTASTRVPADTTRAIALRARGEACEGAPRMQVRVDGEVALEADVPAVAPDDPDEHTHLVSGPWAAGTRELEVSLVNDHRTTACDRNLVVERVDLHGARLVGLWESFHVPASDVVWEHEPAGGGRTLPHRELDGYGGPPVVRWSSGSMRTTIDLPDPVDRIHVVARADVCEGRPRMVVEVDGEEVLDAEVGTTWGDTTYPILGSWAAGPHEVRIGFPNDHRTDTCDRNLKIAGLDFFDGPYGGTYAIPAAEVAGTDFDVPDDTGSVYSRGTAGTPTVVLWQPATATAVVPTAAVDRIDIQLWGASCSGSPSVEVRVDGEVVEHDARGGPWAGRSPGDTFRVAGSWPAGHRHLEVSLLDGTTDVCTWPGDLHIGHVTFVTFKTSLYE